MSFTRRISNIEFSSKSSFAFDNDDVFGSYEIVKKLENAMYTYLSNEYCYTASLLFIL